MKGNGLIVGDVAPAFAFTGEQLWIETPRYDRVDDRVVDAIGVIFFRNDEELSIAAAVARSFRVSEA